MIFISWSHLHTIFYAPSRLSIHLYNVYIAFDLQTKTKSKIDYSCISVTGKNSLIEETYKTRIIGIRCITIIKIYSLLLDTHKNRCYTLFFLLFDIFCFVLFAFLKQYNGFVNSLLDIIEYDKLEIYFQHFHLYYNKY